MSIKNCSSYPYYGHEKSSIQNLIDDFKKALSTTLSCYQKGKVTGDADYFSQQIIKLYRLIFSSHPKSLLCTYGEFDSFYAASSQGLDNARNRSRGLPKHHSVIFDTNRMAGNFPLGLTNSDIARIQDFYGDRLNGIPVVPGTRNPFRGKIRNTEALLFHELIHWVGHQHFEVTRLDFTYLTDLCCFKHEELDSGERERACQILFNPKAWVKDELQRTRYIERFHLHREVEKLIRKYHSRR